MEETNAFSRGRKRPYEDSLLQNSTFFKIRSTVRDLRPQFIELLKTPDFRNCKAAKDILEGMKTLMDLCKQAAGQTSVLGKCSNTGFANGEKSTMHQEDTKPAPIDDVSMVTPHNQGTQIVGGSAFGWNFITFSSGEAVYYGRTKDAFRTANPKSE